MILKPFFKKAKVIIIIMFNSIFGRLHGQVYEIHDEWWYKCEHLCTNVNANIMSTHFGRVCGNIYKVYCTANLLIINLVGITHYSQLSVFIPIDAL